MMKRTILSVFACLFAVAVGAQVQNTGYPITPVPFTSVRVTGRFWKNRLDASRKTTVPLAFDKCGETGRYDNFHRAAHPDAKHKVGGFPFDDTDVYKTIEGASYMLQTCPDAEMESRIDSVLRIVAAAQEPDGYLYTARTMNPEHPHPWAGTKRWEKVEELSHEFYNLGHLLEGAVAHHLATGKRNFLDIAAKYADCVAEAIGDKPHQTVSVPGHQIAEMGLAKLYLLTGKTKYLDLARFFTDRRGYTSIRNEYSQSHKPVTMQDEAVGHAVRAGYMYAGIADVAALTGDTAYIRAIDRIWDNVTGKKLYITGGIGARHEGEAFGDNYELPNLTAYNETCAAISNVYWNHRLFLLHGDAKYFDVLERTLYNGLISGVSLDGGAFFYPNPLESDGKYRFNADATLTRQPWFGCACCPSNICRFIPSLPGYVYAVRHDEIYVNLFMGNTATLDLGGGKVTLTQTTEYPWNGDVKIEVKTDVKSRQGKLRFALKIRIPGWVRGKPVPSDLYAYSDDKRPSYFVKVNGEKVESALDKGYFTVSRLWSKGDAVEVHFDMEPRTVKADDRVADDRGKIAVECGPVVYCAEEADNEFDVFSVLFGRKPEFTVENSSDLDGINRIRATVQALDYDDGGRLLTRDGHLSMIPYYAWNHRGAGKMAVWFPRDVSAVRIATEKNINP